MEFEDLFREAVIVPTIQGITIGGLISSGITAGSLAYAHTSGSSILPWQYVFSTSFFFVSGIAVAILQKQWANYYLPDQRPSQVTTTPAYAAETRRMTVLETQPSETYTKGSIIDLPEGIRKHQIHRAAMLIVHSGWSFSHALLSGANRPFSRKEYELFRDTICFPKGWITWKNNYAHNQGVCVLRAGKNAFRYLSSPPSSSIALN